MTKADIRARIEEIGIIPGIRVAAAGDAEYAAEAVYHAGIPVAEINMKVPHAVEVIRRVAKNLPDMIVGAGTVLDAEQARRCLDAGARFLTSTGMVTEVVEVALSNDVVAFPGALTPTDVISAWKSGADFVKIFPCSSVGGPSYIRALKAPFPQIPLIATGGVNQLTAGDFILAGATVVGVGVELMPREAVQRRQDQQIRELARRFMVMVKGARSLMTGQ